MKKRLQIFTSKLGYGGIEREVVVLANSLSDIYDIELIFLNKDDSVVLNIDKKIDIKILGINNINIFNSGLIKKAIYEYKPDIIISTESIFNKFVIKSDVGKKVYWEHNHHDNSSLNKNMIINNSNGFYRIIVPNRELYDLYKKYSDSVSLIQNAIEKLPNIISNYKSNNIIFVGKLESRKNILELLEIFKRVHIKKDLANLYIIGSGSEKNKIINKIRELKLTKYVHLLGELNTLEIEELFKNARVFVSCSQSESFGRSLVEAMSYAIPSVVYDSNGTFNEIIDNEINGFVIENHNISKMVDTIIKLLDDEKICLSIGACGREKASTYDINNMKTEWIKIL